jgi:RNA polymerase sigma factor (sigma-70 family)
VGLEVRLQRGQKGCTSRRIETVTCAQVSLHPEVFNFGLRRLIVSNSDQSSSTPPAVSDRTITNRSDEATLELLQAHEPLIAKRLRRAKALGLIRRRHQWDDARQAARLGFLEAAARFDETCGTTIGAFARPHIYGAILAALEADAQQDAVTDLLDTVMLEEDEVEGSEEYCSALIFDDDPAIAAEGAEAAAAVRAFVMALPHPHQEIVREVFWEGRLQADVARDRGVSRKTITKTLDKVYARGRVALAAFNAV